MLQWETFSEMSSLLSDKNLEFLFEPSHLKSNTYIQNCFRSNHNLSCKSYPRSVFFAGINCCLLLQYNVRVLFSHISLRRIYVFATCLLTMQDLVGYNQIISFFVDVLNLRSIRLFCCWVLSVQADIIVPLLSGRYWKFPSCQTINTASINNSKKIGIPSFKLKINYTPLATILRVVYVVYHVTSRTMSNDSWNCSVNGKRNTRLTHGVVFSWWYHEELLLGHVSLSLYNSM